MKLCPFTMLCANCSRVTVRGQSLSLCFNAPISFFVGFLLTLLFDHFTPVLYVVFVLVGMAWAFINVNSLPMVVEMCSGADTGKFTGYYYTFSMAAQTVTPVLAGTLMNRISYHTLFPYAGLFLALAFVTMLMVRHGDSKAEPARGIEAFDVEI